MADGRRRPASVLSRRQHQQQQQQQGNRTLAVSLPRAVRKSKPLGTHQRRAGCRLGAKLKPEIPVRTKKGNVLYTFDAVTQKLSQMNNET